MEEFIKRPDLLEESNRDEDLFSLSDKPKNLLTILNSTKNPTVTVLIGAYGSGKTVLLHETKKLSDKNVKKKSSEKKNKDHSKWVFFECWQYPDKIDLWEALIIQLIGEIGGERKKNKMLKKYSSLPGWRSDVSSLLSKNSTAVASVGGIWIFFFLAWNWASEGIRSILIALFTSVALVLLASIQHFIEPRSYSNVSRLNDYKSELENVLIDYEGSLYIVLEDVDRAGELGRRFFETVSHFLKENHFRNRNIKIIVPVAMYNMATQSGAKFNDSVLKASDNILNFTHLYDCTDYISEVFTDEFLDEYTKHMITATINPLLKGTINLRQMKHTLRNAILKYERLMITDIQPDLAICIAVEFSKYMSGTGGTTRSLYDQRSSNYEHIQLYEWAKLKKLISDNPDSDDQYVETRNRFIESTDAFSKFIYNDAETNISSSGKKRVNREYYISRIYFEDM